MARNIVRSSVKLDTFVQVKLVPSDWFPNATSHKTKIQRKCDSPVFEEKFELPVSPDESSVRNGHILFLLKTRQFFQSSEGFAETVLPLDDIPSVDTHTADSVKNKILIMNLPKNGDDYTAIKALKFRTWDKRAISFLQKISFAT